MEYERKLKKFKTIKNLSGILSSLDVCQSTRGTVPKPDSSSFHLLAALPKPFLLFSVRMP
jgi:hypothetical protein